MREETKHEQEIRFRVVALLASDTRLQPGNILEYAIPLSEWILGSDQKSPSNTGDKE